MCYGCLEFDYEIYLAIFVIVIHLVDYILSERSKVSVGHLDFFI